LDIASSLNQLITFLR